jgi:hypothetical protein
MSPLHGERIIQRGYALWPLQTLLIDSYNILSSLEQPLSLADLHSISGNHIHRIFSDSFLGSKNRVEIQHSTFGYSYNTTI